MKRIFIAIDVSEAARTAAAQHIDELRRGAKGLRVGWERPEKLHLTLKFLGDIEGPTVTELVEALVPVASKHHQFGCRFTSCGVFPPKGEPRVLWIGLDNRERLADLAKDVGYACAGVGFPPERRKFSPHITIARLREPSRSRDLAADHARKDVQPVLFTVDKIVIYESKLQPSGSIYSRLATLALGRTT